LLTLPMKPPTPSLRQLLSEFAYEGVPFTGRASSRRTSRRKHGGGGPKEPRSMNWAKSLQGRAGDDFKADNIGVTLCGTTAGYAFHR
jgi:hypothetical protein